MPILKLIVQRKLDLNGKQYEEMCRLGEDGV
jgi:hypothetical protein